MSICCFVIELVNFFFTENGAFNEQNLKVPYEVKFMLVFPNNNNAFLACR